MQTSKILSTDVYSFKVVVEDCIYVDKTDLLRELIRPRNRAFFLTRPRRFGKSLTISTLEQIFKGNKELFKDLSIYKSDYDWQEYPVIRLDMTTASKSDFNRAIQRLNARIAQIAQEYGVEGQIDLSYPDGGLEDLIIALNKKYQKQVVILIDEYDKPITDRIPSDIDVARQYRSFLKEFYGILKSQQNNIRFAFLTGVSKFSKAGVFSGLNSVTDISMKPEYASLCGYTKEELEGNFKPFIDELAKVQGLPKEQLLEQMQLWYNGYRFSDKELKVYNPYSILQLLSNKKFKNYWFSSGAPELLVNEINKKKYYIKDFINIELGTSSFDSHEIGDINIRALMYYTGYITIKDIGSDQESFIVDIPNYEIRKSLNEHILLSHLKIDGAGLRGYLNQALEIFQDKDFSSLKDWFYQVFTQIDYQDSALNEAYFKGIFQTICIMLGFKIQAEQRTNRGRIDAIIDHGSNIYLFEFKTDQSAERAIKQIIDKKYYEKFQEEGKEIYLIGVSFSIEDRNVSELEVLSLDEALKI